MMTARGKRTEQRERKERVGFSKLKSGDSRLLGVRPGRFEA